MPKSINSKSEQGFFVQNTTSSHTWSADEPTELEGTNLGPTPKELLLSSLSSCIAITLRMYAKRKEWDLGEISINLEMIEEEAQTVIFKSIDFSNKTLDQKQIQRLLDISNRCPVVKMLRQDILFQFKK